MIYKKLSEKNLNISTLSILITVLILTIILSFNPLILIGYTTSDDLGIGLSNYHDFLEGAISSGRATWVMGAPIEIAGSLKGENSLSKIPRIIGILILLISIVHLINVITSDINFGVLIAIIFTALWQNSWQHNGITSYPLLFTLSLALLLFSVSSYSYFLKNKKIKTGIISGILLFSSFVSELFPSLIWIHMIVIYNHLYSRPSTVKKKFENLIYTLPFILPFLIFFILYFLFSKGNITYQIGNFYDFLNSLIIYTTSGLPVVKVSIKILDQHSLGDFVQAFGKALLLIISILAYYISNAEKSIKKNTLFILFILGVIFAFWVNIPISLTERYQNWVKVNQATMYIYTVYSTIGFVVSISSLVVLLSKIKGITGIVCQSVLILTLSFFAAVTQLNNKDIFNEQKESQSKWKFIDDYAKTGIFEFIPKNSLIAAPSLYQCYNIVCPNTITDYWKKYLKINFNIDQNIKEKIFEEDLKNDRKIYFSYFEIKNIKYNKDKCLKDLKFQNNIIFFSGLSLPEDCGSIWTTGEKAEFILSEKLPQRFILKIYTNGAFGPNVNAKFYVNIGATTHSFLGPAGISTIEIPFEINKGENIINIFTPIPISPSQITNSPDHRKLGINIYGLEVIHLIGE